MKLPHEKREKMVGKLAAHLLRTGLSQASLRQLAAAAGVSDRMLLYYFTDKTEVLGLTMARIANGLAERLGNAIPAGPRLPPAALIARAARFSIEAEMRPMMRLWIEVVAAAARREAPFEVIAQQVTQGFLEWIDQRLEAPIGADRQAIAATILAMIDGIALVAVCTDAGLSSRAVDQLELG